MLDGIHPELDLGIKFVKAGETPKYETVELATVHNDTLISMGMIEISLENISKLKPFHYVYSEKGENGENIISKESLIEKVPREFETNETIGGFFSEDEEIEF